ncbi:uncharacterized protein VDAG_07101 [Verticillium dahliae VdLs.17]|uniref:Uncharacterized protein n=1 Tax=Verticillium dahliae (strain VdLs.17 / ATCC MYA-4575 / FGSC 10137) TaxID=498257 RepID=G2XAJ8_VERDV|nr:uncharacterized protein VDAG_07101 [Verticillium dahliae VdLs.17]EGY15937.1 hypothetical protein VDAG_07101 [Verticillium dahliae VdLs.17]
MRLVSPVCRCFWLPLLFIPTNASPAFILLFFVCTYFLNRPCVYCSFLLLILFFTSCNWSDRCFFDFSGNWFQPRAPPSTLPDFSGNDTYALNATVEVLNTTASALAGAAADEFSRRKQEWTGLGIEWLRSLLGKREWRIDCLDVIVRL